MVSGCAIPGARNMNGGTCPAGEICSSTTPEGLSFTGTQSSDDIFGGGLAVTAVGGTQTINVLIGQDSDATPFLGGFDAKTTNAGVFTVEQTKPPELLVRGQAIGTAALRLLEPGTDKLLDRVDLTVAPVTKVTVFPRDLVLAGDVSAGWAMLAGSATQLVVQLHDRTDARLVDQTISMAPQFGEAKQMAWDLFEVTAPDKGPTLYQVKTGEGTSFSPDAAVVSAVDDISISPFTFQGMEPLKLNLKDTLLACFVARAGGTKVAGATWQFTPSAGVEIIPDNPDIPTSTTPPGCTQIRGAGTGMGTLTVTASGVKKTFNVMVSQTAMRVAAPTAPRGPFSDLSARLALGARAQMTVEP